jgi:hypothetical protein
MNGMIKKEPINVVDYPALFFCFGKEMLVLDEFEKKYWKG